MNARVKWVLPPIIRCQSIFVVARSVLSDGDASGIGGGEQKG
jgi:hypothetical protein